MRDFAAASNFSSPFGWLQWCYRDSYTRNYLPTDKPTYYARLDLNTTAFNLPDSAGESSHPGRFLIATFSFSHFSTPFILGLPLIQMKNGARSLDSLLREIDAQASAGKHLVGILYVNAPDRTFRFETWFVLLDSLNFSRCCNGEFIEKSPPSKKT